MRAVTGDPANDDGGVLTEPVHHGGNQGKVLYPDAELVGGVQPMLQGQLVEGVEDGAARA